MKSFFEIYQRASERKGGEQQLKALISSQMKTPKQLIDTPDDRYLSEITKAIFKAGFVWRVIDKKWPGFEQSFWQFNVTRCAYISEDDIDQLMQDERIVRNRQKVLTVQSNAAMLFQIAKQHQGFGKFLAEWPEDDFIGLLSYLKKNGSRLGGNSCQYFLRFVGKDGFVLGRDGIAALIDAGVVDKTPTSQTAMRKVQEAYNFWREESGLGYAQISRVLAMSTDAMPTGS